MANSVVGESFGTRVRELGWGEQARCVDPECGGVMESEVDGDHNYLECLECGYTSNYTQAPPEASEDEGGTCAIGVPVEVRQAMSGPAARAAASLVPVPAVELGSTIGRRPGM